MNGHGSPVFVRIERLVLDGVSLSVAQREHLKTSLECELARLIAENVGVHGFTTVENGGLKSREPQHIAWGPNRPQVLGRALAQNVYVSMHKHMQSINSHEAIEKETMPSASEQS